MTGRQWEWLRGSLMTPVLAFLCYNQERVVKYETGKLKTSAQWVQIFKHGTFFTKNKTDLREFLQLSFYLSFLLISVIQIKHIVLFSKECYCTKIMFEIFLLITHCAALRSKKFHFLSQKICWALNQNIMILGNVNLIHSADPQSRPVVVIIFAHVVRPSVHPHFLNLTKQTTENNGRYWRDCGSGRLDHWWHIYGWLLCLGKIVIYLQLTMI